MAPPLRLYHRDLSCKTMLILTTPQPPLLPSSSSHYYKSATGQPKVLIKTFLFAIALLIGSYVKISGRTWLFKNVEKSYSFIGLSQSKTAHDLLPNSLNWKLGVNAPAFKRTITNIQLPNDSRHKRAINTLEKAMLAINAIKDTNMPATLRE